MIVVNFSHPLTEAQLGQLADMTGKPIDSVVDVACQFDNAQPFARQIVEVVDAATLSPHTWQQEQILINPPAYAYAAGAIIAELHGRMGYFPTLIRIRPVANSTPPLFEVAELISLQEIRDIARLRRQAT